MNYNNWSHRDFLDDLWDIKKKEVKKIPYSFNELKTIVRNCYKEIDELTDNRIIMGTFRYGLITDQNFDNYDMLAETFNRVDRYKKDGNLEHIVDAVNMLKLFFYWQRKNGGEFIAIDDGVHSEKIK